MLTAVIAFLVGLSTRVFALGVEIMPDLYGPPIAYGPPPMEQSFFQKFLPIILIIFIPIISIIGIVVFVKKRKSKKNGEKK